MRANTSATGGSLLGLRYLEPRKLIRLKRLLWVILVADCFQLA